ncbi:MAG: TetR family transcriptional regulator [Salinivirgaceae bacterium]|nr:TetR family transcriptional regulator [Salinivirgaceae bacterium]MDD4746666.1 TetR family transcriptional regulator [Salinivirgaceae bacterium]MDY0281035.1 TetR family transcriptional regulator [Salinivirgaceae bacterium]
MVAKDSSTEEKIKNAARHVFHIKGYAGTRTRDIAEEAGINLALLNYYFRSKEKLFEIVMMETLRDFLQSLTSVFNDMESSFETKLEMVVNNYITLLVKEPEIPLFILSELRRNPTHLLQKMNVKEIIMQSYFVKQLLEVMEQNKMAQKDLLHLIINIIGMTIFPFVAKPIFQSIGEISNEQFSAMMEERKTLIPKWIKAILTSK